MTKLTAIIAFTGDFSWCDPDAAAEALLKAGYVVHRLPPTWYPAPGGHPLDDHIEVEADGVTDHPKALDGIDKEIEKLVHPFGGSVIEIGPIEPNYVPFSWMSERVALSPYKRA